MVFFSCIPKPCRFLQKRCRPSSIKPSTKESCKFSAEDRSDFSSHRDHIHNQNHNQNPAISEEAQELPFDIITEILSWLPVKSLLRFKCVCKTWRSLLGDYKFTEKHMVRARPLQFSHQHKIEPRSKPYTFLCAELVFAENFRVVACVNGLFLEESRLTAGVSRIRNFATGHELYLPDAHTTGSIGFALNLSTGEYKVVCSYKNVEGQGDEVGFKVLCIGKDDEWRNLKLPNQNKGLVRRTNCVARPNEGCHSVELTKVGEDNYKLEVISLDLWSERFTINTLPQGIFKDLDRVSHILWKNQIAFADIVGEALHVMVLNDFKEHEWSNITVPLQFLKDHPVLKDQIKPCVATVSGELEFVNAARNNFLVYDMKEERITATLTKSTVQNICFFKPSLVTVKGMK